MLEVVWEVKFVARVLSISPKTIYRMISRGELRAIRLGRALRIPASALDELLSRRDAQVTE